MKQVYPSYYNKFRCIAGDCRHSCCIGWEIDVDTDTMRTYKNHPDILRNIDTSAEPAHFILTEGERCPFLNECGLCEIILNHGEDHLCQICADHPRFRNFFEGRTETGLGLCCEAAARLILGVPDKVTLTVTEDDGADGETENERQLFADREHIFGILQNRDISIDERVLKMLEFADAVLPEKSMTEWAEYFMELECLDPSRDEILSRITDDCVFPDAEFAVVFEQLLVYFVYRHLAPAIEDGMFAARAAFAVLSYRMIRAMAAVTLAQKGSVSLGDLAEAARLYSSEVEYSEENMDEILWMLDDAEYN